MKIITKKVANKTAEKITNQLRIIFKSHGVKPKEIEMISFETKIKKALGGEKNVR